MGNGDDAAELYCENVNHNDCWQDLMKIERGKVVAYIRISKDARRSQALTTISFSKPLK